MKKKLFIILFSFFSCLTVMAEDVVQVLPFSAPIGLTENDYDEEYVMDLCMTNTQSYTAMQFDIYLPEGLTLQTEDEVWDYNRDRFNGITKRGVFIPYHVVGVDAMGDVPGHYFVTMYEEDLDIIKGNDGWMIRFYYLTSPDMKPGVYPIIVKGTVLTVDSHNDLKPVASVSYVKIGEPSMDELHNLGTDLYIPSFVQEALDNDPNIIVNNECRNLLLTDNMNLKAGDSYTVGKVTYNANVTPELGYKTLVLPYDCEIPEGFEAYAVNGVVNNELQMNKLSSITANIPVILKNAGVATMTAANVTIDVTGESLVGGELVGTYEKITAPVGSYVLQNHSGNVAFYQVGDDVQPKVGSFRAYLSPQIAGAKRIGVNFDNDPTSILMHDKTEGNKVFFNIAGQRVEKLHRGVNIIRTGSDVKKTLVK